MTSDGDEGIIVYDTNVNILVPNDQFEATTVYLIQVAAVNVIGQGPVRETILSKGFWVFDNVGLSFDKWSPSTIKCTNTCN